MSALFLTEDDVRSLIDMPRSIEVVEDAFRALGKQTASITPRQRARAPGIMLHTMSSAAEYLGFVGWKVYTSTSHGLRFLVGLYDVVTGDLRLLAQADVLGQLRTGAATGVATKFMARPDSETVGVLGTGLQARTQLEAVCAVRSIKQVDVYSRDEPRRREFAAQMSELCGVNVTAASNAWDVVPQHDIVICATTSKTPVFAGEDLSPGAHVNAIGGNFLSKREVDRTTLRRSARIVCDNIDQCRMESGELVDAVEAGIVDWADLVELGAVVSGQSSVRESPGEITLFKSVGLAVQDVAMAAELFSRATARGIGSPLPF